MCTTSVLLHTHHHLSGDSFPIVVAPYVTSVSPSTTPPPSDSSATRAPPPLRASPPRCACRRRSRGCWTRSSRRDSRTASGASRRRSTLIGFIRPQISILESYYRNRTKGIFTVDFPDKPRKRFDFTGVDPLSENMNTEFGTKLFEVEFGSRLEIVFQGTSFLNTENHLIHVHGHNFFVVGSGFWNFDPRRDVGRYNLVDPP